MKMLDVIAAVLLVIGGLNWALVGAARFDLVAEIFGMHFGETSALSSVVYLLVGLSAVYQAVLEGHPAALERSPRQSPVCGKGMSGRTDHPFSRSLALEPNR